MVTRRVKKIIAWAVAAWIVVSIVAGAWWMATVL